MVPKIRTGNFIESVYFDARRKKRGEFYTRCD
jgi:hypothetical protein